jgi:hypothetical protein
LIEGGVSRRVSSLPEPPERSDTPCREISPSSRSVSLKRLTMAPDSSLGSDGQSRRRTAPHSIFAQDQAKRPTWWRSRHDHFGALQSSASQEERTSEPFKTFSQDHLSAQHNAVLNCGTCVVWGHGDDGFFMTAISFGSMRLPNTMVHLSHLTHSRVGIVSGAERRGGQVSHLGWGEGR